ncbi:receptor-like serine/threonine-protein kinase SD1-7 [Coffea arabica]|uniref:non-specific serine/threonine protein kinase n=1 Tax=Coffea arabica TaxID=13443 RepID=A0A6P6SXW0_COFAR|nr:G-type lectin S-receptor-like serine/threonine-protein kinase At1g11410 [Coffea arabica]
MFAKQQNLLEISEGNSFMASVSRIILLLLVILPSNLPYSIAQNWIKAGYWYSGTEFPIADINSALFSHLICAFADINSSTYELRISPSDQKYFSAFTSTVKQKNPSVITLLSIGGGSANYSVYSSMVSQFSSRKSFIDSSINIARLYGFKGIDFSWRSASTAADATNMETLFNEWGAAVESESRNNSSSKLFLTMAAPYSQYISEATLPIDSIRRNMDWVHVLAYDFYTPVANPEHTGPSAALYDPASNQNTDFGMNSWISGGLPANKIVLALPFFGYAWTLRDPKDNAVGAPANGSAVATEGDMTYKAIRDYIQRYNAVSVYNTTYVMKYCSVGSTWIGFDDVEVVKTKVSYAKQRGLRGYAVWQVPNDYNWELSRAAAEQSNKNQQRKKHILLKTLLPVASLVLLLLGGFTVWHIKRKQLTGKELRIETEMGHKQVFSMEGSDSHSLQMFSFDDIKAATNDFSNENKLGQGGYGPVYKAILLNGREVAVKRLSATSKQGIEEFKNEVLLTARLQHVNLVSVLGFCIEREEKMLVYEYMPNKSLDFYIYDPINRSSLNWEQRAQIIEGVTQGLLYLQEYSRLTVIHRDLKASNILLDDQMKPKISDFGIAKIFQKDKVEANTDRVVGTYGYVPPEYVREGIYSTKSDVFSFGVLLLQIISGRKNTCFYGPHSNINLLEYAYELWKNGEGKEFLDETLDDTHSSCKLMRCLQIALQCVQEDPNDRPNMLEISHMLRNENLDMKHPKRPAFSIKKDEGGDKPSTQSEGTEQVDTATITRLVAR